MVHSSGVGEVGGVGDVPLFSGGTECERRAGTFQPLSRCLSPEDVKPRAMGGSPFAVTEREEIWDRRAIPLSERQPFPENRTQLAAGGMAVRVDERGGRGALREKGERFFSPTADEAV